MGVERLEKLHIYLKGRSHDNSFRWFLYPRQVGKTSFQLFSSIYVQSTYNFKKIRTFNRYSIESIYIFPQPTLDSFIIKIMKLINDHQTPKVHYLK